MDGAGYGIIILILLVLGVMIYFLPAFIGRHKKDATGILLLNLFLGWTALGWIGALIWAIVGAHRDTVVINNVASSDTASQLEKLNNLRKEGALTEQEFQEQKRRILGY